jgi:hypothetical protein
MPADLESGFKEVRLDIQTSCVAVGLLYQLASQQRELRSAGPAPPSVASSPPMLAKLRQQKIQFLRAASIPEVSGRRIKIRSPLFTDLSGPDTVALLQDLLTSRLAIEVVPA